MIHWGIIGLGNIAKRFAKSLRQFDDALLYAGASHNPAKRQFFKEQFHVQKLYDDYDEMLEDETIDAIYIALPHKMHALWAKKAMLNGKHVLVEKPVTISSKELEELIRISHEKHLFFMEAMKTRFMPATAKLRQLLDSGEMGDILEIHDSFCGAHPYEQFKNSYIYDKKQGGALYDMGVYGLAAVLDYIKSDLTYVSTRVRYDHDVDCYDLSELIFENGQRAYVEAAMDETDHPRKMAIRCTHGEISLEPFYRPTELVIDGNKKIEVSTDFDDFYYEIKAVHDGICAHSVEDPRMSHDDSLRDVLTMERIKSENYG